MSGNSSNDDIETQMDEISKRAKKMGVSGSSPSSESGGGTVTESVPSDTEETAEVDENDSSSPQQAVESEPRTAGGPDTHEYPNPDRELGALADVYANNNVFLSPGVVDAVESLWDDIEYEWKKSEDSELNKNWDFYMACFRVILNNPDLIRDELGMDVED
jgi:hypothetical protein